MIEYLSNQGINIFKRSQDLNKFLVGKDVIRKEEKFYLTLTKYEDLMILEFYKGKPKNLKYKNDYITWLENNLPKPLKQGELF